MRMFGCAIFFALGIAVENLFAVQEIASCLAMTLTAKSLGTESPTRHCEARSNHGERPN